MSIKKNRDLMVEQIKRLRVESVNKLNEGKDKDLNKAINLLYNVDDLIEKARLNDLDDDADKFDLRYSIYMRAKEQLNKLLNTIKYINQ